MNKNTLIGIVGTLAFAGILVVMWGSGGKAGKDDRAVQPNNSGQESSKPSDSGSKAPQPGKPAPIPDIVVPTPPPVKDPSKPPVEPDPATTNPPVGPAPTPQPLAPVEYGPPAPKPRISFDPADLDESKRIEAAGNQEIPVPWLKEEPAATPSTAKDALPSTYTVPNDMSLYRVAEIVYGNADRWTLLFEANKAALEDPEKVRKGTVLKVPDPSASGQPSQKQKGSGLADGLF